MKKIRFSLLLCILGLCLMLPVQSALAAEGFEKVAAESDYGAVREVGVYGMTPISGSAVADGSYTPTVESSSPMFQVQQAELTVRQGEMTAVIRLGGTGYSHLYLGTAAEAAEAEESAYIPYTENADGSYSYEIPVAWLNYAIPCAAFSKAKGMWYDRSILFRADSLPAEALAFSLPDYDRIAAALAGEETDASAAQPEPTEPAAPVQPVQVDLPDGSYAIGVELSGGSGKAMVSSPALMTVKDGKASVRLEWSSSNYDYMKLGTETYWNSSEEGANSVFELPITAWDTAVPVIADTTAMGDPVEISYSLCFYKSSIGDKSEIPQIAAKRVVYIAAGIIVGGGILNAVVKKKRRK